MAEIVNRDELTNQLFVSIKEKYQWRRYGESHWEGNRFTFQVTNGRMWAGMTFTDALLRQPCNAVMTVYGLVGEIFNSLEKDTCKEAERGTREPR